MLAELVLHQRAPPSRRGLGEALRGGDAHGDAPAAAVEGLPPIPRFQGLPGPFLGSLSGRGRAVGLGSCLHAVSQRESPRRSRYAAKLGLASVLACVRH